MAFEYSDLVGIDVALSLPRPSLTGYEHQLSDFRSHLLKDHRQVRICIPLSHAQLSTATDGGSWSQWLLLLSEEQGDCDALARLVQDHFGDHHLQSINRVHGQRSIDMPYPLSGKIKESSLLQWVEYVYSAPEHRADYYQSQYEFSGPAMRRLYEANRVGRFMGVEIQENLFRNQAFSSWDVVHVSGFTPLQLLRSLPHFRAAWRARATELAGESAAERLKKWDVQRTKYQIRARQLMAGTISPRLAG